MTLTYTANGVRYTIQHGLSRREIESLGDSIQADPAISDKFKRVVRGLKTEDNVPRRGRSSDRDRVRSYWRRVYGREK